MPSSTVLSAVCVGLMGWSCASACLAQDGSGRSAVAHAFPWDRLPAQIVERRYRVEALRFKALDETGLDWAGADEVMVEVCDGVGCTATDEIGGIDSGDVHDFLAARSCVFGVVPGEVVLSRSSYCDFEDPGRPAPVSFRAEMWEKDLIGFPTGFCVALAGVTHHWPTHCVDDGNGDDFIGQVQVDFAIQEIEEALPNVGDELIETVGLSPCEGLDICGLGLFDGDYNLTYRVYRVPDGKGYPQFELAEAVRRVGATSELDAVLAALRALRPLTRRPLDRAEMGPPAAAADR